MNRLKIESAKTVVHAQIGREPYQVLEDYADRRGCSLTQALRALLEDVKQRELEDASASRLESILRALANIAEQHARMGHRIESLVAILRSVEQSQESRENKILLALEQLLGFHQLTYAHLLAIVETSPRSAEIVATVQAKLKALRGEG